LSKQCGQLGSGYYRESAERKGGGDHSMRELQICFSGGPRGWNRGLTNLAFSLQTPPSESLVLPGHVDGVERLWPCISLLRRIYKTPLERNGGCRTLNKEKKHSRPYSGAGQK
jgi:hypothetical protein